MAPEFPLVGGLRATSVCASFMRSFISMLQHRVRFALGSSAGMARVRARLTFWFERWKPTKFQSFSTREL